MQKLSYSTLPNNIIQSLSAGMIGTWNWLTDEQSVTIDKNLAMMLELEGTDSLSLKEFLDHIHTDDREAVQRLVRNTAKTHDRYDTEFRMKTDTGLTKWFLARGEINQDSEQHQLSGVLIDVTDQKQAEKAQRESENKLLFMADSMPQLVWITRPDGYHEYYNKRWYDYTGTESGDTDGEGWKNLFHPDDQDFANKRWQESLKTGDPYEVEYRLYHAKTKTYRWVIGRARAFRDENGSIQKWYGTCTDIDDQKHGELIQTFLAEASKQLATSLDYKKTLKKVAELCVPQVADWCSVDVYDNEREQFSQVAVAHVDDGKLAFAKRYSELHPVTLNQTTGTAQVYKTGETEFYPVIDEEILKAAAIDDEARELVEKLNLKSIIITPLLDRGSPIGVMTFVSSDSGRQFNNDDLAMAEKIASRASLSITNAKLYNDSLKEIDRRKALERELLIEQQKLESRVKERTAQLHLTNEGLREEIQRRQATELELERSNKELQDFAYVASHDLQEPLRKIQAFGDILKIEYHDAIGDGSDYLDRMMGASARMSSLIQDLLAFSRVTNGDKRASSIDLNDVVAGVVDDLSSRVKDLSAKITVAKLPQVIGDETHMRQLFQNLLSNALKFHKDDIAPVIDISVKDSRHYATISITDNGIGFDEKYTDRIFAVFQRLHGREQYQGTGIGLAVCRKIVEKYDGTISARSKPGKGSTFIVRLRKKSKE